MDHIKQMSDYDLALAAAEARKAGATERLEAIEAERKERDSHPSVWLRALRIAIAWLIVPTLVGFLIAAITQEHGAMFFVMLGFFVGVMGAIVHPTVIIIRSRKLGAVDVR